MPRTQQHSDRHAQKTLGFFLQCNADSESAYVFYNEIQLFNTFVYRDITV